MSRKKGIMHICVLSGETSYLSPKDKKNPLLVLRVIENDPNVSTWDMCEHDLWKTVYGLVERGLLVDETKKVGYPWHRFILSDEGRKYLAAQHSVQRIGGNVAQNDVRISGGYCAACGHSKSRHQTMGGFCKHCECNAFVEPATTANH
ncbi:MAG: hypothetical protein L0287_22330 [Anaerolineae bacterium]|nr:hypothetical protein [Anaerolineae bacterium]